MVEFTFGLRYDSIPAEVIAVARRHLADTLACALGAHGDPIVLALREHAIASGGRAGATIISTKEKVPAASAALVNGTMVRHLDANDIFVLSHGGASGHFSDSTAGLLALAEQSRRGGEELLTCLIAAYELQGALTESLDFWERGFHPLTSVAWVVPIVAARLIGATPAAAAHACGLAASTGSVINTWIGPAKPIPMIKSVAVGLALQRALEAAELAALGVTAPEDALETILARPSQSTARFDPAPLENLGRRWSTTRNLLKLYPAQVNTQAAIEAAIQLHRRGVRAERVQRIVVRGHRRIVGGIQGSAQAYAPGSRESADHSTPYVVAMALLRGRLTPEEYENTPWETPEVKTVMSKVEMVIDAKLDRDVATSGVLGVRLTTELKDGRIEEIVVDQPKGHPDAPLSDADLLKKMTWLLQAPAFALDPRRLLDLCNRLSSPTDIDELMEACRIAQG